MNAVESVQTFAKQKSGNSDHSPPNFEINLMNKEENQRPSVHTSSKKKFGNTTGFQLGGGDSSVRESGSKPSISMKSLIKNAESKSIVSKKSGANIA